MMALPLLPARTTMGLEYVTADPPAGSRTASVLPAAESPR